MIFVDLWVEIDVKINVGYFIIGKKYIDEEFVKVEGCGW